MKILLTLSFILSSYVYSQTFINFTITQDPPLIADASAGGIICPGSSVLLSVSTSGGNGSYSYDWTPTSSLSNATISNPNATPTATTNYTVVVTDGNNCNSADSVLITVIDCSGIEETNVNVTIYPNPNDGTFQFSIENLTLNNASIQIYGMDGKMIYNKNEIQNGITPISLSSITSGTYMLLVYENNRIIKTQKITIQ